MCKNNWERDTINESHLQLNKDIRVGMQTIAQSDLTFELMLIFWDCLFTLPQRRTVIVTGQTCVWLLEMNNLVSREKKTKGARII